jgi:hypothetical protein
VDWQVAKPVAVEEEVVFQNEVEQEISIDVQ